MAARDLLATLLSVSILLASCSTPGSEPKGNTPGEPSPERLSNQKFSHTLEEANKFIRRFEAMEVGLVNYFEPSAVELVERGFSCETVVFQLDNTGDTGALYQGALEHAADLTMKYGWPEEQVLNEYTPEGHIALVRIESVGMPAGAGAGSTIPVRVVMLGDGHDIRNGFVYPTPLKNKLGKTIALLEGGKLPLKGEVSPDGAWDGAELLERRETAGRVSFVLRDKVVLARGVSTDELSAEMIVLPLYRLALDSKGNETQVRSITGEELPDVLRSIREGMAGPEINQPCEVSADGVQRIMIKPIGVREMTLRQIYELVGRLKVKVHPRNNVVIVFDDENGRVAVYGPHRHRFLIGDFSLVVDPLRRTDPSTGQPIKHFSRFRVSCRVLRRADAGKSGRYGLATEDEKARGAKPDGDPGLVRLAWSRWNKEGEMIAEGSEDFPSADISEILRHLWTRGMGPWEVMGFCVQAKESFAISAQIGFNYRKRDMSGYGENLR